MDDFKNATNLVTQQDFDYRMQLLKKEINLQMTEKFTDFYFSIFKTISITLILCGLVLLIIILFK